MDLSAYTVSVIAVKDMHFYLLISELNIVIFYYTVESIPGVLLLACAST